MAVCDPTDTLTQVAGWWWCVMVSSLSWLLTWEWSAACYTTMGSIMNYLPGKKGPDTIIAGTTMDIRVVFLYGRMRWQPSSHNHLTIQVKIEMIQAVRKCQLNMAHICNSRTSWNLHTQIYVDFLFQLTQNRFPPVPIQFILIKGFSHRAGTEW